MDEESCKIFDELISQLENNLCVVITHRLDESLKLYDEIIVLENGQIVAVDSYDNLKASGFLTAKPPPT
jgi:ABC-type multidrug transport system fused ATPase/permease subunit